MINDKKVLNRLFEAFPRGYINSNLEFIAYERTNLYFNLGCCETELDVKCKILEWFSRDAYKAMPYRSEWRNDYYNSLVLHSINKFLDTTFTMEEIGDIYTYLGNGINHKKTIKFIESGYDMSILEKECE